MYYLFVVPIFAAHANEHVEHLKDKKKSFRAQLYGIKNTFFSIFTEAIVIVNE